METLGMLVTLTGTCGSMMNEASGSQSEKVGLLRPSEIMTGSQSASPASASELETPEMRPSPFFFLCTGRRTPAVGPVGTVGGRSPSSCRAARAAEGSTTLVAAPDVGEVSEVRGAPETSPPREVGLAAVWNLPPAEGVPSRFTGFSTSPRRLEEGSGWVACGQQQTADISISSTQRCQQKEKKKTQSQKKKPPKNTRAKNEQNTEPGAGGGAGGGVFVSARGA
jgi:hypothetical protein